MINVELMRSIFGKWNKEVLCHLYSLLLGAWVKLPLSHINALPPFSVRNGILRFLWLWDGRIVPWDFPYSAPL